MIGAFLFLTQTTIRNRMRARLRRVRSPRYALALLLGAAYFWLILLRPGVQPNRAPTLAWANAQTIAALGILLLLLGPWVFKGERMALAFTPAEVQFLFPAPVTRRGLLTYKLFRSQLIIALNALIWVFVLRRSGSVLPAPLRLVGTWAVFTNLSLHRLGASLVRTSLLEHGRAGIRRQLPALIIGVAVVVAVILIARDAILTFRATQSVAEVQRAIETTAARPAAAALLFVPKLIVAPSFAQTAAEWLRAIGPALVLLLVQMVWVLRSDVAFEDAAVQASVERARRIDARRRRTSASPAKPSRAAKRTIPLAPLGAPAVAIIWKNAIQLMRTGRVGALVGLALMSIVLALPTIESNGVDARFLATASLALAGLLLLLGSRVLQNDFRQDAEHLATLKVLPLRGRILVGAEVLSSALPIVAMQLALIALAFVALLGDRTFPLGAPTRAVLLLLAPVVLLALNLTTVTIQNGAVLLFPAWTRVGPIVGGGVEAMGQGILATGMLLLTFVAALLPAVLVFALVWWAARGAMPSIWIFASLAATGTLLGETWWAIRGLGRRFERMEGVGEAGR